MDNQKPKTLGDYVDNPEDLVGKTFELEGTETTYEFRDVFKDKKGSYIAECLRFNWWAGGTSDPETIDLTEYKKNNYGLLSAIELVKGVNAIEKINPAAIAIINYL